MSIAARIDQHALMLESSLPAKWAQCHLASRHRARGLCEQPALDRGMAAGTAKRKLEGGAAGLSLLEVFAGVSRTQTTDRGTKAREVL